MVQRIDYLKIKEYINYMKTFKWVEEIKKGIISNVQDNALQRVSKFLSELSDIIDMTLVEIDNIEGIKKLQPLIAQIRGMTKIEDSVDNLKEEIQKSLGNYDKKLKMLLE